ncbi:hypothetical protein EDB84DRAFT_1589727 [Lactarius hengduanensis]|nr:hypothetical protein EDB84DRAFT_1589727 [Lactarius hengduanensis]
MVKGKYIREDYWRSFAHRRVNNPYYPFQGREEWGLARFLARSSLSQSEIDEFLKLEWVQRLNPTFTSAHALRSLIESLPDPPRWYCDQMIIESYESKQPIHFYWRDALSVIEYIFGNPVFASYMQYDPQRLWTDASRTERIYSEYMTGDLAWQSQDSLPDGATQLAVVAMTGGLEMYPAYLSLANIVSEVRMKATNHAWMCFGFLPIVKFEVHPSFQSILSARLWHACMDKAFARCKARRYHWCFVADPHGRLRWSFPLLAAWIADLPEQHLISAVAKITLPTISCPKELGLSGVHLPFWRDWYLADPFYFLVPEILHTCHKFFFDPSPSMQMTGREHRDIQRSIIAVMAGAVPPRSCVPYFSRLFLTDAAISSFVDSLQEFHDERAAITAAGARLEQWQHFARSTKMMGAPIQWTADVTEALHITEVKHPFRATKHRNLKENKQDLHPVLPPAVAACEEIIMSERPMQNYFLKGLVSSNSLAAFHLKKTPDIASISIGEATRLYALQDFGRHWADFMGCPDVGFEAIRYKLRSVHDSHVLLPAQTVQVLPPSKEHPHGLCDTVLIHGLGGAGESDESVQGSASFERTTKQPVSLLHREFSFAGRRAEDGSRLEEENVDMYLLRRQFRSQVVGNGTRMRMGDIIPLTDIAHTVDLVPVYGAKRLPNSQPKTLWICPQILFELLFRPKKPTILYLRSFRR